MPLVKSGISPLPLTVRMPVASLYCQVTPLLNVPLVAAAASAVSLFSVVLTANSTQNVQTKIKSARKRVRFIITTSFFKVKKHLIILQIFNQYGRIVYYFVLCEEPKKNRVV